MSAKILTLEDFAPHVGTVFEVPLTDGGRFPLTLTEAIPLPPAGPPHMPRLPFELGFHSTGQTYLPQRTYPVDHPVLGEIPIFIVPLGPDPATGLFRYQAVFN